MIRAAIIVAGGSGTRMKAEKPKQFIELCGKPVIAYSIERFREAGAGPIVVVINKEYDDLWQETAGRFGFNDVVTTYGGATRTASSRAGLAALSISQKEQAKTIVAVHDAARPLVTKKIIDAVYDSAASEGGAVCGVPLKSSIRRREADGSSRAADRTHFWEVQTPQAFLMSWMLESYRIWGDREFSDDASLVEAGGFPIEMVEGDYRNIKITTPEDARIAEAFLKT